MKKILTISIFIILLLNSCTMPGHPIRLTGTWVHSYTDNNINYTHTYIFNNDGTYSEYRGDDSTYAATGNYYHGPKMNTLILNKEKLWNGSKVNEVYSFYYTLTYIDFKRVIILDETPFYKK